MHKKLFVPGPVEVREEVLKEMSRPMIGHRMSEFQDLFKETTEKLKKLMYTKNRVFISTSSSTGLMEAAVRNCVRERCLNLVCGAFSERWHEITKSNGKKADKLEVEWGKAIKPGLVDEALSTGNYDAVTLVHNETSTGIMNPLEEISKSARKHGVSLLVDTVSSMGGVKIDADRLEIDVCLFGVQKAMGLPPGLAVASVSERAMEKAKTIENRGYYFDFLVFDKYLQKNYTPATPCIPHIRALNKQLELMLEEGLANIYARHKKMAELVREWGQKQFELFSEQGYRSRTVTAIKNTRGISIEMLNKELGKRGYVIANGYGKLKEKTFRIAHMGNTQPDDLKELLENIDEIIR